MGKVLHASGSGYFPGCVTDGTPPERSLGLTLEEAMGMFWRVRTWEARASGTQFYEEAFSQYNSNSYSDLTPFHTIEKEEDLVCYGNNLFPLERSIGVTVTPTSGDPPGPPYPLGSIIKMVYGGSIIKNDSLYYFDFYIEGFNCLTFSFTEKVGTYNVSYLNHQISGDLFGPPDTSGSTLIEINAKTYWSYGGTYDTTTGTRL
jgi:hypothetical protein